MSVFQIFLAILGRIFISFIFIIASLNNIYEWQAVSHSLYTLLSDWVTYSEGTYWAEKMFHFAIPLSNFILGASIFIQLLGGILVLFGLRIRLGAFLLLLFLIIATLLKHPFWFFQGVEHDFELSQFLKNSAIIGGLFILLAFGSEFKRGEGNSSKIKFDLNR